MDAISSIEALDPGPPPRPRSVAHRLQPAWDEAPLRVKVGLMVTAAAVAGLGVGVVEARLGHQVWPMMLGMVFVLGVLWWLTQWWVAEPFDRLLHRLELIARSEQTMALRKLPVSRQDEVGRIAKAVHRVGVSAVRHQHEAQSLRRTLDSRIAQATNLATRQLKRMALRDPLTDLGNRRFLEEYLEPLVELARAADADIVCIMIDVDNFKQVNDTHGHGAGDELLVFLGSLIRACVRQDDLAARLGGDELVVFLPSASLERARQFAESIRRMFRQQVRVMNPTGPYPDLSFGVASLRRDGCISGDQLLARADACLYEAKRGGKGQIAGLGEGDLVI